MLRLTRLSRVALATLLAACAGGKGGGKDSSLPDETGAPASDEGSGPGDEDEDGILAADDCDDTDPSVGATTWLYTDADADGFGNGAEYPVFSCPADGWVADDTDCDDANPDIHPGSPEIWCDGMDQDCDEAEPRDGGRLDGTLYAQAQDAIDAASDGALVEVCGSQVRLLVDHPLHLAAAAPGVVLGDGLTIDVPAGEVTVTGLKMTAGSRDVTDMDGNEVGGCLAVLGEADVVLDGMNFEGCIFGRGSALYASTTGTVTIRNSAFSENVESAVLASGSLLVEDSTFQLNTSDAHEGGAISASGPIELTRVTFDQNSAGTDGGALYHEGPSATLTEVTFLANSAEGNGGGAMFLGALNTLVDVTFDANTALGDGGAVWTSSAVTSNTGGVMTGNTAAHGGGVMLVGAGSWAGGTWTANVATSGGGVSVNGTWSITDVTMTDHTGVLGTAIDVPPGADLSLVDSIFDANEGYGIAVSDAKVVADGIQIFTPYVGVLMQNGSEVTLSGSTIDGAARWGVDLMDSTLELISCIISNNLAGVDIWAGGESSLISTDSTWVGNTVDVDPNGGIDYMAVDGTFTCDEDACYD